MDLASLLEPKRIISDLQSSNSKDAIEELVDHLCKNAFLLNGEKDKIINSLFEREDRTTTGIGSSVAIPHATSDVIDKTLMIFGRSLEGIDFEAIDNNPVNFVILFLIPESDNNHHLQTLASIARFFTKGNIRETLLKASTETEILQAIENHSK